MSVGENTQPTGATGSTGPKPDRPSHAAIDALAELESGILVKIREAMAQQQDFEKSLEQRVLSVSERETEVTELKQRLTDLAQSVAAQRTELDAQRASFETERAACDSDRNAIDAARLALQAREHELEALTASSDERTVEARARLDELAHALDARERELDANTSRLAERESEALANARTQLQAAQASHAEALSERDALAAKLAETEHSLRSERERLAESLRSIETARAQAAQAQAQASTAGSHADRDRESSTRRFADLMTVIEEYEAWIACERRETVALMRQLADSQSEAAQAGEVIDALKARLKTVLAEAAARPQAPAASSRAASWVEHRRKRLQKLRGAISLRTARLQKGEAALTKRFEACEQLLSQRAALATTHQKLRAIEHRQLAHRASSRAATVGICSVITVAVLAVLSWVGAREFAPAKFEAEAVLTADAKGRPLGEGELAEWQRYHESLLLDPLYHEAAADRFKRQGGETLVTPAQVAELVRTSMSTESLEDGELRVRLRGQGADQTERVLDTLTAALASHANASASRRIDGGVTKVTQPATAGDFPIDQTRNVWTLIGFGASTVAAFAFMGLIYLRLSRAKTQFEKDATIAATLDDPRWVDPRATTD